MALSKKFRAAFLRFGFPGGFFHLLREVLSRYIKVQLVYCESGQVKRRQSSSEIHIIKSSDDIEHSETLDDHCPDWRSRLANSCQLVCVKSDGEIAGFGWGRFQNELSFSYVKSHLPLDHTILYVYDCYTLAPHRGKGIYKVVLEGLAGQAGTHETYVACRWNNTGSIKGIRKAGFVLDQVFVYFTILGRPVRFHY